MPVRTYQDAVEHLTDQFAVDRAFRIQRNIRRAVEEAYRDLPQQGYWSYYRRRAIINTAASQTSGTITYTHSTRIVTLASSTFPSNAEKYRIIIGNVHYDIESYTDSTHVVLPSTSNPGANVAAGTAYTLYRNEYPLPVTFRRAIGLFDSTYLRPVQIITDSDEQALQIGSNGTPGVPAFACIRNTGETIGSLSLVFNCPPNSAVAYDLLFDAIPRPFVLPEKYSTGTVTISSGSASVSSSGATFASGVAGCVLRVTTSTTEEPTAPFGALIDQDSVDNPYSFQSVVKTRDSSSALTLMDAADQTYTTVKYSLSDPLDIEDGAMLTAFLRLAEWHYARLARMDRKEITAYEQEARSAVLLAKENDRRVIGDSGLKYVDWQPMTISPTE